MTLSGNSIMGEERLCSPWQRGTGRIDHWIDPAGPIKIIIVLSPWIYWRLRTKPVVVTRSYRGLFKVVGSSPVASKKEKKEKLVMLTTLAAGSLNIALLAAGYLLCRI